MANCAYCGKKLGMFDPSTLIMGGSLCKGCLNNLGLNEAEARRMTPDDLQPIREEIAEKQALIDRANYNVADYIYFNDDEKYFLAADEHRDVNLANNYQYFRYDQLVDYELIENGGSLASGGVGRAVVGGMLFGAAGAIVGSTTRSQQAVCNNLVVKITVKDNVDPSYFINILYGSVEKNSPTYTRALKFSQDIISKLQIIADENAPSTSSMAQNESPSMDPVSELRRYKELADEGIITAEEFETKKAQLLGL